MAAVTIRARTSAPRPYYSGPPAKVPATRCRSAGLGIVGATTGRDTHTAAPFPIEVAAAWLLFAVVSVEIIVTYSRLPPEKTYNVSRSGLAGGLSRAVTFWNWPLALVAVAVLAFLAERLARRWATVVACVGIVLCGAILWPGIVDQSNLDAKAANAVPALGVLVALGLTLVAVGRLAPPAPLAWQGWDGVRIAVAAVVLVLAVPWLAADLGVSFEGVPVLGTLFQSGELRTEPGQAGTHPAVHAGHHHGMSGVLLVLSALLLSRLVSLSTSRWLRGALAVYVALMFCYGAGVFANDFWLEQVVKRRWTDWQIPNVNNPKLSIAWGVIVLIAAVISIVWGWRWFSGAPEPQAAGSSWLARRAVGSRGP